MKKRTMRVLALLLAVVMTVSMLPSTVLAVDETKTATLVTDAATLKVGDEIVIAAKDAAFAMGEQKTNNRAAVAVEKSENKLTLTAAVQTLKLESGLTEGSFAFKADSGYLYAAGQSKSQGASKNQNYLKVENTLTANSSWAISIAADGKATVVVFMPEPPVKNG